MMTEVMKAWPIIDSEEFAEIGAVIFKDKQTIRIRGISKRSMFIAPHYSQLIETWLGL